MQLSPLVLVAVRDNAHRVPLGVAPHTPPFADFAEHALALVCAVSNVRGHRTFSQRSPIMVPPRAMREPRAPSSLDGWHIPLPWSLNHRPRCTVNEARIRDRTAEAPAIACPEFAPFEAKILPHHVRKWCALGAQETLRMSGSAPRSRKNFCYYTPRS